MESIAEIYDCYAERVYTYMRYRVNDGATADDLTAQTFEQVLNSYQNYQPEKAPLAAWLFGIAHNVVSQHYRKQKRYKWLSLDVIRERPGDTAPPEDIAIQNEMKASLIQAVKQLPQRERDIIGLKFAAGLNNRQIADIMHLSDSNVGVILYRTIKKLRGILNE